jgi:hypothetical protein
VRRLEAEFGEKAVPCDGADASVAEQTRAGHAMTLEALADATEAARKAVKKTVFSRQTPNSSPFGTWVDAKNDPERQLGGLIVRAISTPVPGTGGAVLDMAFQAINRRREKWVEDPHNQRPGNEKGPTFATRTLPNRAIELTVWRR